MSKRAGADLRFKLHDQAFGGFFSDPGALREHADIAAPDRALEQVDGKPAHDGERAFGADARHVLDHEAKKVAVGGGGEPVERLGVFAVDNVGVELDDGAGCREALCGGNRYVHFITKTVKFDDRVQRRRRREQALDGGDHLDWRERRLLRGSLLKAEHILHIVNPGGLMHDPLGGAQRTPGENTSIAGFMGQFNSFAQGREHHGMIPYNIAASQGVDPDFAGCPLAGDSLAAVS